MAKTATTRTVPRRIFAKANEKRWRSRSKNKKLRWRQRRKKTRRRKRNKHKTLDELIEELNIVDHTLLLEDLCYHYSTDSEKGLTSQMAQERLEKYGLNILTPTTARFGFLKYFKHIFGGISLLLWFGVVLAVLSVFVDSWYYNEELNFDNLYLGCVLVTIAIVTGSLAYYQQSKSLKIIDSFKKRVPQYASVTRDGQRKMILAEELTKGDLVDIKYGDRVPADIRIISSDRFKVDISSLTGENEPQPRSPAYTSDNPLETMNLVFLSTNAIEGTCKGIVINVGDNTVVGQIIGLASHASSNRSPIAREIRRLIFLVTVVAIVLGISFFIVVSSLGFNLLQDLISIVGIIVANVPEGLPVTVTVCLTLIAKRMAQKNCLVINLSAVETLGSASVIITDTTGVLTQNKMTVSHVCFDNEIYESFTFEGHDDYSFNKKSIGFQDLARCAILCSQAEPKHNLLDNPEETNEKSILYGGATELAIQKFLDSVLGDTSVIHRLLPKVHDIPFTSGNKYQVSIHQIRNDRLLLTMKGAPERIFDRCSTVVVDGEEYLIDDEWRADFHEMHGYLASIGERVLGFCDLILPRVYSPDYPFTPDEPNFPLNSLRFLGMISMVDPPRPTVPHAVSVCRSAGIKIIMVTGDHPITAEAIAESVGIISGGEDERAEQIGSITEIYDNPRDAKAMVIHGGVLKDLTPDDLDDILENCEEIIFARTTPKQKLLLVDACQRLGWITAITGSSVNDTRALQKGDIGITMGIFGSDVAREAADIILLDDNFATIVTGVEEGRLVFDNLKKAIAYTLTSNIPEIAPFFVCAILGTPLAVGIITILCIDLGTDLIPAISISYELPEYNNLMQRKPKGPKDKLVNRRLLISGANIGVIETLAGFYSYFVIMSQYGFYPWDLINVRELWDSRSVNDLRDSYGQQWTYSARKELQYTCQTGFFVAIVVVQWANLIICKTSRNSIFQQGMRNWVLNFGLIFETALAAALTYTPGTKSTLKTYPLEWEWWLLPLPFSLFIFVYDEIRKYLIRKYPRGWLEYETCY